MRTFRKGAGPDDDPCGTLCNVFNLSICNAISAFHRNTRSELLFS